MKYTKMTREERRHHYEAVLDIPFGSSDNEISLSLSMKQIREILPEGKHVLVHKEVYIRGFI
ncbi:MAG: hypothetical protein GY820_26855 [Gammaproteobacteria bacterium]|nr:hypothetical protein [Gammaproteobacteria bacterium]